MCYYSGMNYQVHAALDSLGFSEKENSLMQALFVGGQSTAYRLAPESRTQGTNGICRTRWIGDPWLCAKNSPCFGTRIS